MSATPHTNTISISTDAHLVARVTTVEWMADPQVVEVEVIGKISHSENGMRHRIVGRSKVEYTYRERERVNGT